MDKISLIIPCYNEEDSLLYLYEELKTVSEVMSMQSFEFIFVNDGSKDKTLQILRELRAKDERVCFLSFSRNFGKEAAIYAGLKKASGDYIALMDADLQDPPFLLEEMYSTLKNEDCDCVATRRMNRKGEPPIRSFFAKKFYQLVNKISNTEIVDGARDFRLMTRQMVQAILDVGEYNRFSKGIFGWVGFNTKWISYENVERVAGKTKWSFSIFVRRDYCVLYSPSAYGIIVWYPILFCSFCHDLFHYFQNNCFWRGCARLCFNYLCDIFYWGHTVVLYRYSRTIPL